MEIVFERFNYWAIIFLMMMGLYIAFAAPNMIKRLMGLSIFQTSVFLFYITIGRVSGGRAPILVGGHGDGHHEEGHGAAGVHGAEYAAEHSGAEADHAAEIHASENSTELHATYETIGEATEGQAQIALEHGKETLHHSGHGASEILYSNPLPHVLILTAIVVGVATLSVGLAIIVRIREAYGTIEADDVRAADLKQIQVETAMDREAAAMASGREAGA